MTLLGIHAPAQANDQRPTLTWRKGRLVTVASRSLAVKVRGPPTRSRAPCGHERLHEYVAAAHKQDVHFVFPCSVWGASRHGTGDKVVGRMTIDLPDPGGPDAGEPAAR